MLLGRHHSGTWELPGGKVDPTHESVAAAAARELSEETGLTVDKRAVDVFAMLHDVIGGFNRVSMAALVRLGPLGSFVWIRPDQGAPEELPTPLFDPSAQILAAWRPGLGLTHPPAHLLRITGAGGKR